MQDLEDLDRSELEAVIETRRELGPSYEPALVDSFADKVELAIRGRVDAELARRQRGQSVDRRHSGQQLALGIISLVAAIPISVVAAVQGELAVLMVAWVGIVLVNVTHAWQNRRSA